MCEARAKRPQIESLPESTRNCVVHRTLSLSVDGGLAWARRTEQQLTRKRVSDKTLTESCDVLRTLSLGAKGILAWARLGHPRAGGVHHKYLFWRTCTSLTRAQRWTLSTSAAFVQELTVPFLALLTPSVLRPHACTFVPTIPTH